MNHAIRPFLLAMALTAVFPGCGIAPTGETEDRTAREQFWARLHSMCGLLYPGRMSAPEARPSPVPVVMHVRHCTAREIQIMIHVDRTHSRLVTVERTRHDLILTRFMLPGPENRRWPADPLPPVTARTDTAGDPLRQRFVSIGLSHGRSTPPAWELRIEPRKAFISVVLDENHTPRTRFRFDIQHPLPPAVGPGWLGDPGTPGL